MSPERPRWLLITGSTWYTQVQQELVRPRVIMIAHLILDTRRQAHGDSMTTAIARRFPRIKAKQILAAQVVFNRFENWRQIIAGAIAERQKRRVYIADEEVLAAGLF